MKYRETWASGHLSRAVTCLIWPWVEGPRLDCGHYNNFFRWLLVPLIMLVTIMMWVIWVADVLTQKVGYFYPFAFTVYLCVLGSMHSSSGSNKWADGLENFLDKAMGKGRISGMWFTHPLINFLLVNFLCTHWSLGGLPSCQRLPWSYGFVYISKVATAWCIRGTVRVVPSWGSPQKL